LFRKYKDKKTKKIINPNKEETILPNNKLTTLTKEATNNHK